MCFNQIEYVINLKVKFILIIVMNKKNMMGYLFTQDSFILKMLSKLYPQLNTKYQISDIFNILYIYIFIFNRKTK